MVLYALNDKDIYFLNLAANHKALQKLSGCEWTRPCRQPGVVAAFAAEAVVWGYHTYPNQQKNFHGQDLTFVCFAQKEVAFKKQDG